jgi:hypothetical protein
VSSSAIPMAARLSGPERVTPMKVQ